MNETKLQALESRKCVLLMEQTSHEELVDLNSDLPTDTHLVTAERCVDSDTTTIEQDAVRAYKSVDIFDVYHDLGYTVLGIKNGYGACKPKLWQDALVKTK